MTTSQAHAITEACYKLEDECPIDSRERKELLQLARLSRNKVPYFTAADFFNIDRTTLFAFLSVATTYAIIIIQFNQSDL